MPSKDDRPLPKFAVGDEVLSRDAGPGRVESAIEPLWMTGNGAYWSPWKYGVKLHLHGRVQEYSEEFLVPQAKTIPATPDVLSPEQVAGQRHKAIVAAMVANYGAFCAAAQGAAPAVLKDCVDHLRWCLGHLAPQDHSLVHGVLRAQEAVLAHLESLREKAR